MILILSDGSTLAKEAESQLKLHNENFIVFFTDFKAAAGHGNGSVIVGEASFDCLKETIGANYIRAVIDAVAEPRSPLTIAAEKACKELNIDCIKYLAIDGIEGAKMCLYYSHIADMLKALKGNALFYAKAETIAAIAELLGKEYVKKMYVPVQKSAAFDTEAALKYKVPLINVVETEWQSGEEPTIAMIKKTGAKLIVCGFGEDFTDKIAAAKTAGIDIIYTHSMGMEFSNPAATARDAVITLHSK